MRKRLAFLVGDAFSYVTGRSGVRSLARETDDWLHPVDCEFYLDDPGRYLGPFDAAGIPMQVFGQRPPVYVPSRTAAFAFANWNRWRRLGRADNLRDFMKAADWFASFEGGRIEHGFDLAGMAAPWLSGLAQGEALSVFARAGLATGDGKWLDRCTPVLEWLARPIEDGGVIASLPDGSPFIEEYPGSRHRHVLNGCLYGLIGLDDMLRVADCDRARALLADVLGAVERNILRWEADGWSLYEYRPEGGEREGNFNTPAYQTVHIALMERLAVRADSVILAAAARRLRSALARLPVRLRALHGKLSYRAEAGW